SQVISGKNDYITLSIQNEQAAPSPSEVVKRYWKASADGKFSETRRYIDLCSMNPKDSAYKTRIDVLTKLTPKVIYNNRKVPDQKAGELVIGKIEEESLQGDTAFVIAIIHFRNAPVVRSWFKLNRCKGEWKIEYENIYYKDVQDLIIKKEGRKIAAL